MQVASRAQTAKAVIFLAALAVMVGVGVANVALAPRPADEPLTYYNCIPYGDPAYWTDHDRACLPLPSARPPGVIDQHYQ